ncbi:hypothetical protein FRB95_003666 [Tulasnella sp. JGI-2019a]|nr:hypothetical protein FRB95_003666 [Tulasnella sp. JGI-2019a]
MKSIVVASAFILAASAAAVPFTEKSSNIVRRMERPVEVHAPFPFQRNSENKNHATTERKAASNDKPSHTADGSVTVNNRPQRRDNATTTDESTPTSSGAPETTMSGDLRRRDNTTVTEEPTSTSSGAPEPTMSGDLRRRDNATTTNEPSPTASEAPEASNSTMSDNLRRRDNATSTDEAPEDPEARNSTMTEGPADKNSTSSDLRRRDSPTDTQILQYALTLEHLEKAFYDGALAKFNQHAFVKAGLPKFARQRFEQIAEHEATHVEFLTAALGSDAVEACNYNFPYHDPKSFAALSMVLEGVGVSAYLGAAQFIQDKTYLTAAGSILTTESRHAAWVASAVNQVSPWSGAFDIPLDFVQVYSLAALFITDCPSTNPELFKPFPTLEVENKHYNAGDYITLKFNATSANGQPTFLAIFSSDNMPEFIAIENNKAKLPKDLEGTSYGVVTTSNSSVTDQNTVAGVAIFELYSNSHHH